MLVPLRLFYSTERSQFATNPGSGNSIENGFSLHQHPATGYDAVRCGAVRYLIRPDQLTLAKSVAVLATAPAPHVKFMTLRETNRKLRCFSLSLVR